MSEDNSPKKSNGPILRDHVYDGIEEYDQKLPNWWLFTLYIAIAFFIFYWTAHYQFGFAKSDSDRLDPVIAELRAKRSKEMLAMLDDPNLWKMSRDATFVREGEQIYKTTCLPCHGPNMGGNTEAPIYIGRSLVDEEWAYGGTPKEVYKMIYGGTPNPEAAMQKGQLVMPPQGIVLGADGVAKAAAFVLSKHPMPDNIDSKEE